MKKKIILLTLLLVCSDFCIANELNDRINVLYAENNINEALSLLFSIPEEERTSQNWLLMGNILQDQDKNDDAEFMYNSAIAADEKNYKAHYNLGLIYLKQNKPNSAIAEFKKSVKYKSDFAYGYYNLGCAYLQINKLNNAKWEFFKAIDINNQVPDFYYNLAYTYKKLKNEKQAKIYLDYYNKLIERGN